MENLIYIFSIMLILCVFLLLIIILATKNYEIKDYFITITKKYIPKIIHQTAPNDENHWHPIWYHCQDSWKNKFPKPKYKYMLWNDDDLLNLIKTKFPQYLQVYNDFGKYDILKIDFARYAILYQYGGIYADMDFMCMKNFYNKLPNNISIVQSNAEDELVQNSLMVSPKKDKRWLDILEQCKNYFYSWKEQNPNSSVFDNNGEAVLNISGPKLLSKVFDMNKINILSQKLFNPTEKNFKSENIYTKHYSTGKWGVTSGIKDLSNIDDNYIKKIYSK